MEMIVQKKARGALLIPREHGVWAMLLVPFLFGMFLSKGNALHLLMLIGMLGGYVAVNACLVALRQPKKRQDAYYTVCRFGALASLALAYPIATRWQAFWPVFIMGVGLSASAWFVKHMRERDFVHDLIGIIGLSMLLPISAGLGGGASYTAVLLALAINAAYFTGSVFFVKSVFREKNNRRFQWIGMLYHVTVTASVLIFAAHVAPFFALAFLPGVIKMILVLGRMRFSPKTVGMIEIANAFWIVAWGAFFFTHPV